MNQTIDNIHTDYFTSGTKRELAQGAECMLVSHGTDNIWRLRRAFNYDPARFVRYCEMQRDAATQEGHGDAALYIQECIDHLTAQS